MSVVNDAELLALYAAPQSELFPALRREGVLKPLVVLLAVLPPLFALVNDDINSVDARWGLGSLELLTALPAEMPAADGGDADGLADPWLHPLAALLTALSLRIPGLPTSVELALVSFVSAACLVLLWHTISQLLAGPRFAFWSTALLACHGPFLISIQSASAVPLSALLAVGALWGLFAHLREAEGVVSGRLLMGGISLGLCLLAGGLAAVAALSVGVLLAIVLRFDTSKPAANGTREWRSVPRGRWTALQSVGLLALIGLAVGGWWLVLMLSARGLPFWSAWLGFEEVALAAGNSDGGDSPGRALFQLFDLLGVLFVPALFGAWCLGRDLWRLDDKSRRLPFQFLAAWLACAAVAWIASYGNRPPRGHVWDLFLLLPLTGFAAVAIEEIANRRLPTAVALWLIGLAIAFPYLTAFFRPTPADESLTDGWGRVMAVVGYVLVFTIVSVWLMSTAKRHDLQQRLCLAGLLLALGVANAAGGIQSVQLADEAHGRRQLLAAFDRRLHDVERVDAQILITDTAAPPDVEFLMRINRPRLTLEKAHTWNNGILRATELISEEKRSVLVVDWRTIDGRMSKPPERNLNIESRFTPVMLHGRRLSAYLLTRRIQPL